jgi:hypothetical protein
VTEGVITLKRAVDIIKEYYKNPTDITVLRKLEQPNGAAQIAKMLVEECTHLNMFVGQTVNPAHQNPNLPIDLSIKMIILDELFSIMNEHGKMVTRKYY